MNGAHPKSLNLGRRWEAMLCCCVAVAAVLLLLPLLLLLLFLLGLFVACSVFVCRGERAKLRELFRGGPKSLNLGRRWETMLCCCAAVAAAVAVVAVPAEAVCCLLRFCVLEGGGAKLQ